MKENASRLDKFYPPKRENNTRCIPYKSLKKEGNIS